MSLRDLARDLYRAQRRVVQLERRLPALDPARQPARIPADRLPAAEIELLTSQLAEARAEMEQLRRILDGHKANAPSQARKF